MKRVIFTRPSRRFHLKFDFKKNGWALFFLCFLLAGIIIGAICTRNADRTMLDNFDFFFLTNFTLRSQYGAFDIFVSSFAAAFVFLLAIFLLGLSAWGMPVIPLVILFKGFGFGLSIGYLYGTYAFMGIWYNMLVILPGAFLNVLVLISAACIASKNALRLLVMLIHSGMAEDIHKAFLQYLYKMMWLLVILAISCLVDMVFTLLFANIFQF